MSEFDRRFRQAASVVLFCLLVYWTWADLSDGSLDNWLLLAALMAMATGSGAAFAEWLIRR